MPFRISIPSISSLNDFWPESKQLIAVPHDLQTTISSPISTVYLGFNVIMALGSPVRRDTETSPFKQQSSWILDSCDELWHFFQRWTTGTNTHPLHDGTIALYMQLLETFAIPEPELKDRSPYLRKATSMAFSNVARLVESLATSPASENNQTQLALLITRLCQYTQLEATHISGPDVRHGLNRDPDANMLRLSAGRICEQTKVLTGLQKDLQVCTKKATLGTCC